MFETRRNPLCTVPLGERKRKPRRYCCDGCKMDVWALRRVAAMLLPLGPARGWEILENLKNGDTQDKAGGEIFKPGAIVSEVL